MSKTKISQYDPSAANNTDVNGVNIAEGCAPSGINNAIREVMAALKRFETGSDGDSITVGGNLVVSGTSSFVGNETHAGAVTFSGNVVMSSTINGTTIPTSKTLVDTDSGQTLTNKTISGSANTITNINLASQVTGTLPVANGGTGQTAYTNGQLLIGNTTGGTLTKGTLTAGPGIIITNGAGSITVEAEPAPVTESDVGTSPDQIVVHQFLGALAYVDTETPALDVGTGISTGTGTICKVNGGISGGIWRVNILIDLTGLNSGGTAGDIIGVDGAANCYIARLPAMTVLGGRMTCLETPAGGDTDIDLYSANEGTGAEDAAITGLTETQIINAGTQSAGTVTYFAADPTANQYLYLVGQSTSNATYTAGRFLIEIFGVQ
jgi:hypothetical protein